MKKFILVLALMLGSTLAQAESFVHGQYTFRDTTAGQSGEPNRQGVNLTVGHRFNNGIVLDAGTQFRQENGAGGKDSTRLETGLSYNLPVTEAVSLYTRGALGYKVTDADDSTYYSVEPGIKYQLASDFSLRAGYRYRDAFNSNIHDKTNTVRLGAEYNLNKTNVVTLGLDRAYGDSEFIGVNVGYAVKF